MEESSRPVPRPPQASVRRTDRDVAYGDDAADAGGAEDRPSVVADVERALASMADLGPEEQVEAFRDLESTLRSSLRSAGEDA